MAHRESGDNSGPNPSTPDSPFGAEPQPIGKRRAQKVAAGYGEAAQGGFNSQPLPLRIAEVGLGVAVVGTGTAAGIINRDRIAAAVSGLFDTKTTVHAIDGSPTIVPNATETPQQKELREEQEAGTAWLNRSTEGYSVLYILNGKPVPAGEAFYYLDNFGNRVSKDKAMFTLSAPTILHVSPKDPNDPAGTFTVELGFESAPGPDGKTTRAVGFATYTNADMDLGNPFNPARVTVGSPFAPGGLPGVRIPTPEQIYNQFVRLQEGKICAWFTLSTNNLPSEYQRPSAEEVEIEAFLTGRPLTDAQKADLAKYLATTPADIATTKSLGDHPIELPAV